ncbi:DNA repair protein RecN, partial [mine drainage metagenome]
MLNVLQIRDFAIIDTLELTVRPGLTVLTGETGAGQIHPGGCAAASGRARAGAEMIRHGAERAELSATFDVRTAPAELAQWLEQQALGADELIVRRMISADGRSRAWLNGQPVPLQLLREAGNLLIDIHGQHEFQSLTRAVRQRELLDEYGGLEARAAEV